MRHFVAGSWLLFIFESLLDAVAARAPRSSRADEIEHIFTLMQGYLPDKSQ